MAIVGNRLFSNDMAEKLNTSLANINNTLEVIAGQNMSKLPTDMRDVQQIVRRGMAKKVFTYGDKFIVPWVDKNNDNKEYMIEHVLLGFRDVTLPTGEIVKDAPCIQWRHGIPFDMIFDEQEAFYYAEHELPAGTYYVTSGVTWGEKVKAGDVCCFTLAKPVPAGGHIVGMREMYSKGLCGTQISTYAKADDWTPIETVQPVAVANGTNLGVLQEAENGNLNCLKRAGHGSGRWGHSFEHDWLNTDKKVEFKAHTKWHRSPSSPAMRDKLGFMSGYSADFLNCTGKVKIRTALNTVSESSEGQHEDTYDTFFLLSLEEAYIKPYTSGIEGTYFDYWKRAVNTPNPAPWYQAGAYPVLTGIEAVNTSQYNRLRSAYRGITYSAFVVNPSGYVYDSYGFYAFRCAPACYIF